MSFRFLNPYALILLLFIPVIYILTVRSLTGLGAIRRRISLFLRIVITVLLIFALAEMQAVIKTDKLSVLFLLDRSNSIPPIHRQIAMNYINKAVQEMDKQDDAAGLIVFGEDPSVEISPTNELHVSEISSIVSADQTDIAGAIQLSLAAFPEHTQKRIVLLSDGNENKGDAVKEAENAKANDTQIDVVPLLFSHGQDCLVEKVVVPQEVKMDESFELKSVIKATEDTEAKIRLFEDGQLISETDEPVSLAKGKNVYSFTLSLKAQGFHTFEIIVEAERDVLPQNNRGYAYTVVRGAPRILYVESDEEQAHYLADALKKENIDVELRGVGEIPATLPELQNFDSVILSNVPAHTMSRRQMQMIASSVKDLGIGLIMIGGENSFGPGGYRSTPIEEALPVDMEVSQKKVLPKGALVMIMDAAEVAAGNRWALEMMKAAVEVLSDRDEVGIINGQWAMKLEAIGSRTRVFRIIDGLAINDIGPGNDTNGYIEMSYDALKKSTAGAKHIVMMSDAGPGPWQPDFALLRKCVSDKITMTTIVFHPHGATQVKIMEDVAYAGYGNFYYPKSVNELPRIFIKEAVLVRKSSIFDEPFMPKVTQFTEVLKGFNPTEIPQLGGYVGTTAKERAEVPIISQNDDPVLAHWRYGLGKSVAFTSDAKNRWAAQWIPWSGYSKFWAQLVRWVTRTTSRSNLQITTKSVGGKGEVVVDAVDEEGNFVNFLQLRGNVVTPDFENKMIDLDQTAPGRYEGSFDTGDVGAYLINIAYKGKGGEQGVQTTGLAVSYSPEYKEMEANEPLLDKIADITGGKKRSLVEEVEGDMVMPTEDIFKHDLKGTEQSSDIWRRLLIAALLLFPIDIFLRRVVIQRSQVMAFLSKALGWIPRLGESVKKKAEVSDPALARLLAKKTEVRESRKYVPTEAQTTEGDESGLQGLPGAASADEVGDLLTPPAPSKPAAEKETQATQQEASSAYMKRLLEAKKKAMKDTDWKDK